MNTINKIVAIPGDRYRWIYPVMCRDGSTMDRGSVIEVLDTTMATPYDEIGPSGYNLICKAANGITIWATLEQCIDRGLLKKI